MSNYHIKIYSKEDVAIWNNFVSNAKNATFLFHRNFMEYHADRFEDFSLLIYTNQKLVAILPANRVAHQIYSHQGLTYGGLLYADEIKLPVLDEIFNELILFLKQNNFEHFFYKIPPLVYQSQPCQEIEYLLWKHKATVLQREMDLVVQLSEPIILSKNKKYYFKRSQEKELELKQTGVEVFWNELLIPRLKEKYNTTPVHTLQEIEKLIFLFPNNIKQYMVYYNDNAVAGITIFETQHVAKAQYAAINELGESVWALDYLYLTLFEYYKRNKKYFDMGTVSASNQYGYNISLLQNKLNLGAKIVNLDTYKIQL